MNEGTFEKLKKEYHYAYVNAMHLIYNFGRVNMPENRKCLLYCLDYFENLEDYFYGISDANEISSFTDTLASIKRGKKASNEEYKKLDDIISNKLRGLPLIEKLLGKNPDLKQEIIMSENEVIKRRGNAYNSLCFILDNKIVEDEEYKNELNSAITYFINLREHLAWEGHFEEASSASELLELLGKIKSEKNITEEMVTEGIQLIKSLRLME